MSAAPVVTTTASFVARTSPRAEQIAPRGVPRVAHLRLADGTCWAIEAGDERAQPALALIERWMSIPASGVNRTRDIASRLGKPWLITEEGLAPRRARMPLCCCNLDQEAHPLETISRAARELTGWNHRVCLRSVYGNLPPLLWHVCSFMATRVVHRGGLLLHGALATRAGHGVVFAGHSGAGKSTSVCRLPAPWRALADDATLVARDDNGVYWAHSWPGPAVFVNHERPFHVDAREAVPLRAVFFLEQADRDHAGFLSGGEAVANLVESCGQGLSIPPDDDTSDERRRLWLKIFENACAMKKRLAVGKLEATLTGRFWEEIERLLGL